LNQILNEKFSDFFFNTEIISINSEKPSDFLGEELLKETTSKKLSGGN